MLNRSTKGRHATRKLQRIIKKKRASSPYRPREVVWTTSDDETIQSIVTQYVKRRNSLWAKVSAALGGRSRRQCRERWVDTLQSTIPVCESNNLMLLEFLNSEFDTEVSSITTTAGPATAVGVEEMEEGEGGAVNMLYCTDEIVPIGPTTPTTPTNPPFTAIEEEEEKTPDKKQVELIVAPYAVKAKPGPFFFGPSQPPTAHGVTTSSKPGLNFLGANHGASNATKLDTSSPSTKVYAIRDAFSTMPFSFHKLNACLKDVSRMPPLTSYFRSNRFE